MSELKVSISGIRGIWGESLNLKTLIEFTKAFGLFVKKTGGNKILLGRDARPTGKMISLTVSGILNSMGIDVLDCGIIPTPSILYGVRKLKLGGGIIITASHNPIEWNALKFVRHDGTFTNEKDIKIIQSNLGKDLKENLYNKIGKYEETSLIEEMHIQEILKNVSAPLIRKKKFKVVLDPVNSAGSRITAELLKELGCSVHLVNGEINGTFGRGTEPNPANLTHLTAIIRKTKADIGFAQDPDADRLVVIDEKGAVLSEEMTLALAAEHILSENPGDIVVNLSTSMLCEWLARKYGVRCYRTKVGEANVVDGIIKRKARIGGEGNGGVIYPKINCARDSLVGIALILELMTKRKKSISKIAGEFPSYPMKKEKFTFKGNINTLYKDIKASFKKAVINEADGLRLEWDEKGNKIWLHIRPSNTEPVVRVIGESVDEALLDESLMIIKKLIS